MVNKTIDVCGVPFQLVDLEPNGRHDGNFGTCDNQTGVITINSKMPEEIKQQTLVHEWLHGVLTSYGQEHSENLTNILANELYRKGYRIQINEFEDKK